MEIWRSSIVAFFLKRLYSQLKPSCSFLLIRKQPWRVYMWGSSLHWIRSNPNESDIWDKLYWLREWTESNKGKRARKHPHKQGWGSLYWLNFHFLIVEYCVHTTYVSYFEIVQPVISRESFAIGKENGRTHGIANQGDEGDTIICSKSSQEKRSRKTSAVCCGFFIPYTVILYFLSLIWTCQ